MRLTALCTLALTLLLVAPRGARAEDAPATPESTPAAEPAPAAGAEAKPEAEPAPAGEAAAPAAATQTPEAKPLTATHSSRASLSKRLIMDLVSGLAGAGVVLALGWAVALPLTLIPLFLTLAPATNLLNTTGLLGAPVSLLISGTLITAVLAGALAASAALQRVIRPLLGPEPSLMGPVIGAVFFGLVGAGVGATASFLTLTSPQEPFRTLRARTVGDLSNPDGRAFALISAAVVATAVPFAALGAGVGGPVGAEKADMDAADQEEAESSNMTGGARRAVN